MSDKKSRFERRLEKRKIDAKIEAIKKARNHLINSPKKKKKS